MFRTGKIKLNPQINLPFNFLIQKYFFHDIPTWIFYVYSLCIFGVTLNHITTFVDLIYIPLLKKHVLLYTLKWIS